MGFYFGGGLIVTVPSSFRVSNSRVVVVISSSNLFTRCKKNVRKANKQNKIHFHKHIKKKITHFEGDCEVTDKGLQVKQPSRECVSRYI